MPDVAGRALGAAVEASVRDDPGADTSPDLDHDHVVVAGGDAGAPLPEREDVDVVVNPDGRPVTRRESLADRVVVPAGHDRGEDGPTGPELHGTGDADADPPQPSGQLQSGPAQLSEQLFDPCERDLRAGRDVGRLVHVGEDPPIQRGDGHVDAGRAEVGHQHVAGVPAEGELSRRPSARARAMLALDDEAAVEEFPDSLRDDPTRQARPRDQLPSRPGPAQADRVEDDDQGIERLLGERRAILGARRHRDRRQAPAGCVSGGRGLAHAPYRTRGRPCRTALLFLTSRSRMVAGGAVAHATLDAIRA